MKVKTIHLVTLLCIALHSGVIFNAEQQTSGWMQKKLYELKKAATENAESWWAGRKKETGVTSPLQKGLETVTLTKRVASTGLFSGITGLDKEIIDTLVKPFPLLSGMQKGGMVLSMNWLAGLFVVGFAIQKVILYYHNKDITKAVAVNQIKDIISVQLTNDLAYPTRTTKIHALLKKNEFLVDVEDVDGIVALACSKLSEQISASKPNNEQRAKDSLVDAEISKIKTTFVQKGLKTLQEQIDETKRGIVNIVTALERPEVKARISILSRLEKQQLVEKKFPTAQTFEKTNVAKFYGPMTTTTAAQGYKQEWEKGMKAAREKTKQNREENAVKTGTPLHQRGG